MVRMSAFRCVSILAAALCVSACQDQEIPRTQAGKFRYQLNRHLAACPSAWGARSQRDPLGASWPTRTRYRKASPPHPGCRNHRARLGRPFET